MQRNFALFILAVVFVCNGIAGVRGDSKISTDGKTLVQIQDWPLIDQIKIFDLSTKEVSTLIPNAKALIFDDLSKTNCFVSPTTFAYVQRVSDNEGYYKLVIFNLQNGSILATKNITTAAAITCNPIKSEVLIAYENSIQILDGTNLNEKRQLKVQNLYAGGLQGSAQILISPNGKFVTLTNPNWTDNRPSFKVYELEHGQLLASDSFPFRRRVSSFVFSPDSSFFAVVAMDGIGRVYTVADAKMVFEFGHNIKFERMTARFDMQGRLFVADQYPVTSSANAVMVTNFGVFPFAQKWLWKLPGWPRQFNSFEISDVTGQLMIDTMDNLYSIDPIVGTGRDIKTSCKNKGNWLFSPTQPLLINAHEKCGLTEIAIP